MGRHTTRPCVTRQRCRFVAQLAVLLETLVVVPRSGSDVPDFPRFPSSELCTDNDIENDEQLRTIVLIYASNSIMGGNDRVLRTCYLEQG